MAFTDTEKVNIRQRLREHCEKCWSQKGYKKTNIEELAAASGISKGSFYLFYDSKEEVFLDVMLQLQHHFVTLLESKMHNALTKSEFSEVLKVLYREYIKFPFLYETQSPDFIAFINKLSKEKLEQLNHHVMYDLSDLLQKSKLTYAVEEELALSMLGFLFTPRSKEYQNRSMELQTIDALLDIVVEEIFE